MIDITEIAEEPELLCSICKLFLSVSPILLDQNGQNVCGRCEVNTDLKYAHNFCYEKLASQFSFPCKFRKKGCSSKQYFNQMKRHEEICIYQAVKCDIEKCQWSGILSDFILHCSTNHQDVTIDLNVTKKIESKEGNYIVTKSGFYFLFKWKWTLSKFELNCRNLHALLAEKVSTFDLNLWNGKVPIKTVSDVKVDIATNIAVDFEECPEDLFISFLVNVPSTNIDYKKRIICPHCNCQMVPPILKCCYGHITCIDCTTFYFDTCETCDTDDLTFSRVPELEIITLMLIYKCKSCPEEFNVNNIREHEQNCLKRIYECRHCVDWHGPIHDIIPHDEICPVKNYPRKVLLSTVVTVFGKDISANLRENVEYWLIAYNEYFSVDCEITDEGIDVMICNYGLPSLVGWYNYEVHLCHAEDISCSLNKVFNEMSRRSNLSSVVIPNADLEKFNNCYKIIIKVILLHESDRSLNVSQTFPMFSVF